MTERATTPHGLGGFRVFGLTGGIGSGKSVVAALFREFGVPVVDADELARRVVLPGSPGQLALLAEFGAAYFNEKGELDRKKLGQLVFGSQTQRNRLDAIVHPLVRRASREAFEKVRDEGGDLCCYDIPLLFETKQADAFRPVVVVWAEEQVCLRRIVARDGISEEDAARRIAAQIPLSEKRAQADFVIENRGSLAELRTRTEQVLRQIRGSA